MTEQCKKCLEEFEAFKHKHNEHDKRIALLEDFENWARPILEAVKTIKNDNRWMIIIFVAFVTICTYVYQTDIKNFMKDDAVFISSGIIHAKVDEVKASLEENGLEIIEVQSLGEWNAIVSKIK